MRKYVEEFHSKIYTVCSRDMLREIGRTSTYRPLEKIDLYLTV